MIKPNSEPCAFHSERKKTVRSAILDFVTKKVQNWKKTNKKLKRKKMDLKKWKKIQEKLINFVVVLFFVNVNRSAVRFFPSLYYCTAHITHSFDYKFNILCIISTLASFSSLTFVFFFFFVFRRFDSGDDSCHQLFSFSNRCCCWWFCFSFSLFFGLFVFTFWFFKVIRIRHRQWFCQLHQLPFVYVFAIAHLFTFYHVHSGERKKNKQTNIF